MQVLRAERHALEQGSKPARGKKEGKAAVKAKAAKQKAGAKAKQGAAEPSKAASTAAAAKAWLGQQLAPVSVPAKRSVLPLTDSWPLQPQLLLPPLEYVFRVSSRKMRPAVARPPQW